MTAISSNRSLQLLKPRGPVDISSFALARGDSERIARGQVTDRQARIDNESRKISRDSTLNDFEKWDQTTRLRGNNGDGTSNIRFKSAAEAAEFAQVTQQRLTDSYRMITDGEALLTQIEDYRRTQGDGVAEQLKTMAEGSIRNGYGGIESYTLALQENFNVAGEITRIADEGTRYEPGSFSLSYEGEGFSVRLDTPDRAATAQKTAKDAPVTLVQLLDGVVREWTERTKPGLAVNRQA